MKTFAKGSPIGMIDIFSFCNSPLRYFSTAIFFEPIVNGDSRRSAVEGKRQ